MDFIEQLIQHVESCPPPRQLCEDTLKQLVDGMKQCKLLADEVTFDQGAKIVEHADCKVHERDSLLTVQARAGEEYFILLRGEVGIVIAQDTSTTLMLGNPNRSEHHLKSLQGEALVHFLGKQVTSFGAPAAFGEQSVLTGAKRNASILCLTPCIVLTVPKKLYAQTLARVHARGLQLTAKAAALRALAFCRPWDQERLSQAAYVLKPLRFAPGEPLAAQGARCEGPLLLAAGEVAVEERVKYNPESNSISQLSAKDMQRIQKGFQLVDCEIITIQVSIMRKGCIIGATEMVKNKKHWGRTFTALIETQVYMMDAQSFDFFFLKKFDEYHTTEAVEAQVESNERLYSDIILRKAKEYIESSNKNKKSLKKSKLLKLDGFTEIQVRNDQVEKGIQKPPPEQTTPRPKSAQPNNNRGGLVRCKGEMAEEKAEEQLDDEVRRVKAVNKLAGMSVASAAVPKPLPTATRIPQPNFAGAKILNGKHNPNNAVDRLISNVLAASKQVEVQAARSKLKAIVDANTFINKTEKYFEKKEEQQTPKTAIQANQPAAQQRRPRAPSSAPALPALPGEEGGGAPRRPSRAAGGAQGGAGAAAAADPLLAPAAVLPGDPGARRARLASARNPFEHAPPDRFGSPRRRPGSPSAGSPSPPPPRPSSASPRPAAARGARGRLQTAPAAGGHPLLGGGGGEPPPQRALALLDGLGGAAPLPPRSAGQPFTSRRHRAETAPPELAEMYGIGQGIKQGFADQMKSSLDTAAPSLSNRGFPGSLGPGLQRSNTFHDGGQNHPSSATLKRSNTLEDGRSCPNSTGALARRSERGSSGPRFLRSNTFHDDGHNYTASAALKRANTLEDGRSRSSPVGALANITENTLCGSSGEPVASRWYNPSPKTNNRYSPNESPIALPDSLKHKQQQSDGKAQELQHDGSQVNQKGPPFDLNNNNDDNMMHKPQVEDQIRSSRAKQLARRQKMKSLSSTTKTRTKKSSKPITTAAGDNHDTLDSTLTAELTLVQGLQVTPRARSSTAPIHTHRAYSQTIKALNQKEEYNDFTPSLTDYGGKDWHSLVEETPLTKNDHLMHELVEKGGGGADPSTRRRIELVPGTEKGTVAVKYSGTNETAQVQFGKPSKKSPRKQASAPCKPEGPDKAPFDGVGSIPHTSKEENPGSALLPCPSGRPEPFRSRASTEGGAALPQTGQKQADQEALRPSLHSGSRPEVRRRACTEVGTATLRSDKGQSNHAGQNIRKKKGPSSLSPRQSLGISMKNPFRPASAKVFASSPNGLVIQGHDRDFFNFVTEVPVVESARLPERRERPETPVRHEGYQEGRKDSPVFGPDNMILPVEQDLFDTPYLSLMLGSGDAGRTMNYIREDDEEEGFNSASSSPEPGGRPNTPAGGEERGRTKRNPPPPWGEGGGGGLPGLRVTLDVKLGGQVHELAHHSGQRPRDSARAFLRDCGAQAITSPESLSQYEDAITAAIEKRLKEKAKRNERQKSETGLVHHGNLCTARTVQACRRQLEIEVPRAVQNINSQEEEEDVVKERQANGEEIVWDLALVQSNGKYAEKEKEQQASAPVKAGNIKNTKPTNGAVWYNDDMERVVVKKMASAGTTNIDEHLLSSSAAGQQASLQNKNRISSRGGKKYLSKKGGEEDRKGDADGVDSNSIWKALSKMRAATEMFQQACK